MTGEQAKQLILTDLRGVSYRLADLATRMQNFYPKEAQELARHSLTIGKDWINKIQKDIEEPFSHPLDDES